MKTLHPATSKNFQLLSDVLDKTQSLFWIYDKDDNLIFANSHFYSNTGLTKSIEGIHLSNTSTDKALITLIKSRLDETRKNSSPMRFNDKIIKNDNLNFFESTWFNIKNEFGEFVAGYSNNVNDKRKQSQEIKKLSSRLSYISLSTSDAVWEWEITKNHLHLGERLSELTGYYSEIKYGGFKFWLSTVVHSKDRTSLMRKISSCIKRCKNVLQVEYSITTAKGELKQVIDKIYFIYSAKKLVRMIGSLKDCTEIKVLEGKASQYQSETLKAVSLASVKAQEEERDRISKELHDNINQLILSSKMYISIAKQHPNNATELLDKAVEYQLMALEESRKLSKTLSTTIMEYAGFNRVFSDIVRSLELSGLIVSFQTDEVLINKLSSTQKTMLIRIFQEQSSNILKYANAKEVSLKIFEKDSFTYCSILDNGKGFDPAKDNGGIGFANIKNRVNALGGTLQLLTSPGNGCEMTIAFKTEFEKLFSMKYPAA